MFLFLFSFSKFELIDRNIIGPYIDQFGWERFHGYAHDCLSKNYCNTVVGGILFQVTIANNVQRTILFVGYTRLEISMAGCSRQQERGGGVRVKIFNMYMYISYIYIYNILLIVYIYVYIYIYIYSYINTVVENYDLQGGT